MFHNRSLVSLLSEIFGFPRSVDHGKKDFEYNCPNCDNGGNKFNLSIDVENGMFHCWACGYRGRNLKLAYDHGDHGQIERMKALTSQAGDSMALTNHRKDAEEEKLSLSAFRSLKHKWTDSLNYIAAMRYLASRNITQDIIDKWDMCYAETGKYKNRIIVPSKAENGAIDYFVARDFYDNAKFKYYNPQLDKEVIIFGERFIDWKKPIFITEGVFDAIVLYNSIPILGTNLKPYKRLSQQLIRNRSTVILGFDPDKIGKKKEIDLAKFVLNLGCTVYTLPKDVFGDMDIAEVYQHYGKAGIIKLIKSSTRFDELDAAIATL